MRRLERWIRVASAGAVLLVATTAALPAQSGPNWFFNIDERNVAVDGYDLVAYFDGGQAVRGIPRHSAIHESIQYWFESQEHRDAFVETPERYLPACGGWDALVCGADPATMGFAAGRWRPTPHAFEVIEGRLYLLSERPLLNSSANFRSLADTTDILERIDAFWSDRVARARAIGGRPDGLNPQARLELAEWQPLMGTWDCTAYWLTDAENGQYTAIDWAEWSFRYGFDGLIVLDNWRPYENPTTSGPALRGYDAVANAWKMVFYPAYGPANRSWNMEGHWIDGELRGEYETDAGVKGTIRFYEITDDGFEWISNRSADGGETWVEGQQKASCRRSGGPSRSS